MKYGIFFLNGSRGWKRSETLPDDYDDAQGAEADADNRPYVLQGMEYRVQPLEADRLDERDPVNHPKHYTSHPSGVECIQIARHYNFNVGNAIKYLWRAGQKNDALEDLAKAAWYVNDEIERLKKAASP